MLQAATMTLYENLKDQLPDEFTQSILEGSLRVLVDDSNPIRGNLFALGTREMMRHVLEIKAPDGLVRRCEWFANAVEKRRASKQENPEQITRRDRMTYATQGGISDEMLKELDVDPDEMHDTLAQTIKKLSKFTHVQPDTMLGSAKATDAIVVEVFETLSAFLTSIDEFRSEVARVVSDAVDTEVLSAFMVATIGELDELSSHTQVNDAEVEKLEVVDIDPHIVTLKGRGTVYVHLVYGSASDERRGDGARTSAHYPFTMTINASTTDFTHLTTGITRVDTSSFYE
jgi:hypothetical protein